MIQWFGGEKGRRKRLVWREDVNLELKIRVGKLIKKVGTTSKSDRCGFCVFYYMRAYMTFTSSKGCHM